MDLVCLHRSVVTAEFSKNIMGSYRAVAPNKYNMQPSNEHMQIQKDPENIENSPRLV